MLVTQSCLTLCDPTDGSPPDSFVHGTVAHQAPLSMGFSRQEYWSGLPFPTSGDLPNSGTEPEACVFPALAGRFFAIEPLGSQ